MPNATRDRVPPTTFTRSASRVPPAGMSGGRGAGAVLLTLAIAACGSPAESPKIDARAARLQKAEAAMTECKKRVGLDDVATPVGVALAEPATAGQEMTPEMAGQLRLKVQCALELNELLDARR